MGDDYTSFACTSLTSSPSATPDGTTIFQSVGAVDPFVAQIILGAVNFGCTFLGLYVMERFGRRWPLIIVRRIFPGLLAGFPQV